MQKLAIHWRVEWERLERTGSITQIKEYIRQWVENDGLHQHPPTPKCVKSIADSSENIRHACGGILDFSPRPSLALSDVAKDGAVLRYKAKGNVRFTPGSGHSANISLNDR